MHLTDEQDAPPLMYACRKGDPAIVTLLLQHGDNVNVADKRGRRFFFFFPYFLSILVFLLSLVILFNSFYSLFPSSFFSLLSFISSNPSSLVFVLSSLLHLFCYLFP